MANGNWGDGSRTLLLLRTMLRPQMRAADLAREAGCSQQYVSAVLAGRKPPSARLLAAAKKLGVPVEVGET